MIQIEYVYIRSVLNIKGGQLMYLVTLWHTLYLRCSLAFSLKGFRLIWHLVTIHGWFNLLITFVRQVLWKVVQQCLKKNSPFLNIFKRPRQYYKLTFKKFNDIEYYFFNYIILNWISICIKKWWGVGLMMWQFFLYCYKKKS